MAIAACCLAFSSAIHAQLYHDSRMFSFENAKELQYIKVEKSAVTLSDKHFKNGKKSLEWSFQAGGVLKIDKDLQFEPRKTDGLDNYLSAFIVWVYNEAPLSGKSLVFQFCKQGKVCTSFPMNLNFKGWRGAWVCYERDMKGSAEPGMDEIKIKAPDTHGRLYIDHLITAIKVDPRYQTADEQLPFVNPKTTNDWLQVLKHSKLQPDIALTPVTEQQSKAMQQMEKRFRSLVYTPAKLYPKQMETLRDKFDAYKIRE